MLRSGDRFARQNRDGPPPSVSQASSCPSIVHYLSGSMLRTRPATGPADRGAAAARPRASVAAGAPGRAFGFPATSVFLGRLSRPQPTAPWSVFRDGSRRLTIGGTRPRGAGRDATRAPPEPCSPDAILRSPPPPPRACPRRGCRRASAATISRALSLSLQSSFRRSLAVRLVRYRNRGVISLGRASPAAFGLRYKAGLLAGGGPCARAVRDPRGFNSPRLLATFQSSWSLATRARLPLVTTPAPSRTPDSTPDSILFVRHYSGPPCWFLLLPIVICLSSRGTLLLPDATVGTAPQGPVPRFLSGRPVRARLLPRPGGAPRVPPLFAARCGCPDPRRSPGRRCPAVDVAILAGTRDRLFPGRRHLLCPRRRADRAAPPVRTPRRVPSTLSGEDYASRADRSSLPARRIAAGGGPRFCGGAPRVASRRRTAYLSTSTRRAVPGRAARVSARSNDRASLLLTECVFP